MRLYLVAPCVFLDTTEMHRRSGRLAMLRYLTSRKTLAALFGLVICLTLVYGCFSGQKTLASAPVLLTDPFLQLPSASSVRVVWFTEFAGSKHSVAYGDNFQQTATAILPNSVEHGKTRNQE